VLPGTHSKWAEVEGGRIARFRTFLTGELFHLLRDHSILGRLAAGKPAPTPERARAAFLRGVEAVRREGRAAPLLFTARSLVLAGGMPAEESTEYLSGLVIAEELAALPVAPGLLLIGAPALCERYRLALEAFGAPGASILDAAEATVAGLREIAGMVAT